jgi:uncharacterized protein YbjT (DUF2867 family)
MSHQQKRILVVGATGMLGKPVAEQLYRDGFTVRVLSRSAEKGQKLFGAGYEVVAGDVENPATLMAALQNCQGVHINIKGGPQPADYERLEHQGTKAVVEAAQAAGVQQITYLSSYTSAEKNLLSAESYAKFYAEQAIQKSGVPYTIFRATWFMESLPLFIQGKQAMLIGQQPHPLHWLAAQDYAQMVSRSYQTPAALNKILYIYGPQPFTMRQAMEFYLQTVRPEIKLSTMPIWLFKLLAYATFNTEWKSVASLMTYYDKFGEEGSPAEANKLLGQPTTTLAAWSKQSQTSTSAPK